jgi:hypothetical protein
MMEELALPEAKIPYADRGELEQSKAFSHEV